MPLVGVRGVSKVFANGVQALADVSLDVEAGEFLSVLGPVGLRQVHAAAPDRGARPAQRRHDRVARRAGPISASSSRSRP